MKRAAWLSLAFALALAGSAAAQGERMGGMGNRPPMQDHWITADSLVKSLGITDTKVKNAVAPHLAEVDKILKSVADERQKMMASMQGGGAPPSDSVRQAMMAKNAENQKALDAHLGAVREALPEANRAAFDGLQKPALRMGRPGGMRPPSQ